MHALFFFAEIQFFFWEPARLSATAQSPWFFACMFFWTRGHFGEIAGKYKVRPLFLVVIHLNVFGVFLFGIFGLGGQDTVGHLLLIFFLVSKFLMLGAG